MRRSSRLAVPLTLAFVLAAPALAGAASQAPKVVPLHRCKVDGVKDLRCATAVVWENREAKTGRKIPLNIVVLPALGPYRVADPIFFLHGGPGGAATETARGFAGAKELRARRDIVLVDQRGTGGSNGLDCSFYGEPPDPRKVAGELFPIDLVRKCRDELAKQADLKLYNTSLSADDLDDVRAFLGYDKIDLYGGSYGTAAAQEYMRRHPEHVRAVVLDGIAPIDEPIPLRHAYAGQRALDKLLEECAADAACHAAFPDTASELAAVRRRVEAGVTVKVEDPTTHQPVEVQPSWGLVAEGIRFFLYSPSGEKNVLPLQIHLAAQGDLAPLVQMAIENRLLLDHVIYVGMFFSVTCAEDLPEIDDATAARLTAGTFLGDYRIREQKAVCEVWPRGPIPADARSIVHSNLPVILFSGERDPVTPPEFGERVIAGLSNALHVVVPHQGHGSDSDCTGAIVQKFLDQGSVKGLDLSCLAKLPAATFALAASELPARSK